MGVTVVLLLVVGLVAAHRFLRNQREAKWTARGYETCTTCPGSGLLSNANDGAVLGNSLPVRSWTCGACKGKGPCSHRKLMTQI